MARPSDLPRVEHFQRMPCGTRAKYVAARCRCLLCRAAASRYETERLAKRKAGEWNGLVDAAPVRQHLLGLSRQGVGYKSVAASADVGKTTVFKVLAGTKTRLRAMAARRILAVDRDAVADHALISAGPTWRLLNHLRCSTGSYHMQFDVITWPGYLCYAGDTGCFVFSRLSDMFEFFRGRSAAVIDRGYLAEKCEAGDKSDGIRRYNEALFTAAVRSDFEAFTEDWTDAGKENLWAEIQEEVLPYVSDGLPRAVQAAQDFQFYDADSGKQRTVFHDFWEHKLEDFTARFWWCCYAVPWAIAQYDALKAAAPQGEPVQP